MCVCFSKSSETCERKLCSLLLVVFLAFMCIHTHTHLTTFREYYRPEGIHHKAFACFLSTNIFQKIKRNIFTLTESTQEDENPRNIFLHLQSAHKLEWRVSTREIEIQPHFMLKKHVEDSLHAKATHSIDDFSTRLQHKQFDSVLHSKQTLLFGEWIRSEESDWVYRMVSAQHTKLSAR